MNQTSRRWLRLNIVVGVLCLVYPYVFVWSPWFGRMENATFNQDNNIYAVGILMPPIWIGIIVVSVIIASYILRGMFWVFRGMLFDFYDCVMDNKNICRYPCKEDGTYWGQNLDGYHYPRCLCTECCYPSESVVG